MERVAFLLKTANLMDRMDVLNIGQFLTANVYVRSLFKAVASTVTFPKLLRRYNKIAGQVKLIPRAYCDQTR